MTLTLWCCARIVLRKLLLVLTLYYFVLYCHRCTIKHDKLSSDKQRIYREWCYLYHVIHCSVSAKRHQIQQITPAFSHQYFTCKEGAYTSFCLFKGVFDIDQTCQTHFQLLCMGVLIFRENNVTFWVCHKELQDSNSLKNLIHRLLKSRKCSLAKSPNSIVLKKAVSLKRFLQSCRSERNNTHILRPAVRHS